MARGPHRSNRHRQATPAPRHRTHIVSGPGRPLAVRQLAVGTLALSAAVASVLTPARAITLGEIAVESSIGQPLNARIPVQLGAGEMLTAGCVGTMTPGTAELSQVPGARFAIPETGRPGTQDLRVTTTQPLYEPMYELHLQVNCPGTSVLVRQYVLMLDLPGAVSGATAVVPAAGDAAAPVEQPAAVTAPPVADRPARPRRQRPTNVPREPVAIGLPYRVQEGDTLSVIAARVSDRGGASIWEFADRIFAANPDAFIGGNPDLIKLGAEIVIPGASDMAADAAPAAAAMTETAPPVPATPEQPPVEALPVTSPDMAAPPTEAQAVQMPEESAISDPGAVADAVTLPAAATETDVPAAEESPTPVFAEDESPSVEAAPAAATARAAPAEETRGAPSWLAALAGLLIGAGASFFLLRDRLMEVLRGKRVQESTAPAATAAVPVSRNATQTPLPIRPAREPSMVVVEKSSFDTTEFRAAKGWPGKKPVADGKPEKAADERETRPEPTVIASMADENDRSGLFGPDADETGPVQSTETLEAVASGDLDFDLSAAADATPVDQDIGYATMNEDASPTATDQISAFIKADQDLVDSSLSVEVPWMNSQDRASEDTVEQLDLQTMSQRALGDEHLAETLRDALDLLESDYEEEMSSSQRMRKADLTPQLNDEEDTLARTGTDRNPRPRR